MKLPEVGEYWIDVSWSSNGGRVVKIIKVENWNSDHGGKPYTEIRFLCYIDGIRINHGFFIEDFLKSFKFDENINKIEQDHEMIKEIIE